jgi:hypothetical protein
MICMIYMIYDSRAGRKSRVSLRGLKCHDHLDAGYWMARIFFGV